MLTTITAAALLTQNSRFELVAPLALPPIKVHHLIAKSGVAQSTAARLDLQARILWVDATANIVRYNTPEKIATLCLMAKETGFNTIVFDVKPIVGYTVYPSKLTEQITSWRNEKLTPGFDPLHHMVEQAHKQGLQLLVSLNAFSEGHSYSKRDDGPNNEFFKPGWGYQHPELTTTRRISYPAVERNGRCWVIDPNLNPANYAPEATLGLYQKVPTATLAAYATLDSTGKVLGISETKPDQLAGQFILAAKPEAKEVLLSLTPGESLNLCDFDKFVKMAENQNQIPLMMNPHIKANQDRALAFVDEIVSNYQIDGLLYDDRLRFGGLDTDFSAQTLEEFRQTVKNAEIEPRRDIYTTTFQISATGIKSGLKPGRYFDDWLAFRAKTMSDFVAKVRAHVKRPGSVAAKNQPLFGIYAGSWYGDYPKYGSNYASADLNAGFPFLTHQYKQTGFAESLDLLVTGAYYRQATVYDTLVQGIGQPGRTVEAAGIISNRVAQDMSWTVAGIMLSDFKDDPSKVKDCLQAAAATTQGIMVFDLSHEFEKFQPTLKQAFKRPAKAPYADHTLIDQVRKTRRDRDARHFPQPPFPFFEGAPGTGF